MSCPIDIDIDVNVDIDINTDIDIDTDIGVVFLFQAGGLWPPSRRQHRALVMVMAMVAVGFAEYCSCCSMLLPCSERRTLGRSCRSCVYPALVTLVCTLLAGCVLYCCFSVSVFLCFFGGNNEVGLLSTYLPVGCHA